MDIGNHVFSILNALVGVDGHYMGIYCKLGLETGYQGSRRWSDGTYVEDVENSVEIRFPCGNRVLVILCVEVAGEHISLVQLLNVALDRSHSPVIEGL